MKANKFLYFGIVGIVVFQLILHFIPLTEVFSLGINIVGNLVIFAFFIRGAIKASRKYMQQTTSDSTDTIDRSIYESLMSVSETVAFDTQQLLWLSKDNITAFEQIVKIFYTIEGLSQKNTSSLEEIRANINELAEISENLKESIVGIEGNSSRSLEMLKQNRTTVDGIGGSLSDLIVVIEGASEINQKLQTSSENIHKITEYIGDISSRTNLLSLNAAIEAARAGEAGRGFSVVAQEIRKLSEETKESISEIEKITKGISEGITRSSYAMNTCMEKVKVVEVGAGDSSAVVVQIQGIVETLIKSLGDLTNISTKQASVAAEIDSTSASITLAVEDTSNMTSSLIRKVDLQKDKNNDMLQFSTRVGNMAGDLQEVVVRLKTSTELIFGVNPFTSPENIRRIYIPILEWVCERMGYKARTIILRDYDIFNEGVIKGIIDVGWLSPFAYVNAHEKSGVIPIVTPKVNGRFTYNGYIISKKGSSIDTLIDLKGKHFGYVDSKSASGYIYARHIFKTNGLDPDKMFSKISFMGSHDNVIKAVLSGDLDGGATYNEAIDMAAASGLAVNDLHIISKTEDIPKDSIAVSPRLPETVVNKLKEAFLAYDGSRSKNSPVEGFVESNNDKYNVVRTVASDSDNK